jgi:hypothetical protein
MAVALGVRREAVKKDAIKAKSTERPLIPVR